MVDKKHARTIEPFRASTPVRDLRRGFQTNRTACKSFFVMFQLFQRPWRRGYHGLNARQMPFALLYPKKVKTKIQKLPTHENSRLVQRKKKDLPPKTKSSKKKEEMNTSHAIKTPSITPISPFKHHCPRSYSKLLRLLVWITSRQKLHPSLANNNQTSRNGRYSR